MPPIEYPIYTKQEAIDKGLVFEYWKSSSPAPWALTDDGWVLEVKGRFAYPHQQTGVQEVVKFKCGLHAFVTVTGTWNWGDRRGAWLKGASKQHGRDMKLSTHRMRTIIKVYAQMMLKGVVDWKVLGDMWDKNYEHSAQAVQRMIRQPKGQNMVREELDILLSEAGITRKSVLADIVKAREFAVSSGKSRDMMAVIAVLTDLVDLLPQKEKAKDDGLVDLETFNNILAGHAEAKAAIAQYSDVPADQQENIADLGSVEDPL
jgi:hypothetical protein